MRNYRIITMLAVAATMFFSCQKVQENKEEAIPETKEQTVSFNALPMGETKTAFTDPSDGKYPTLWTTNDEKVKISMNFGSAKDATVTPSKDYTKATFAASFDAGEATEFTFYALSPASACVSVSGDPYNSLQVNIPTSQTPITGSVDEAAQILFAKSATLGAFPTESVNLHFSHLTAYACMTLKNLELSGATISSISITAGDNIAGRWYYYPGDGSYSVSSGSSTITVNTSSASNVMFALAPVDLAGKTLKVVVNTNLGTFTKNVASWPSGKAFLAGHVAKFALDMAGIVVESPKVYNLVKDVAELTAGSKVIIAAAGENFAISSTQNKNNRAEAGVTKNGEAISDPGDDVEVFTVEAGTKDNTFAFLATKTEGYIYAVSGNNYLRTKVDKEDDGSFTVSIAASGVATIGCLSRFLKYNNSNNIFACYASGQQDVAFYKLAGSGAPVVIKPVINVTSDNPMAVSNANDLHAIEYTISNPTSAVISAVANVSWIHDFDYSTAGEVSFEVDAQVTDAAARSGVITLSYTGADNVTVTVNQDAGPSSGGGSSHEVTLQYTTNTTTNMTGGNDAAKLGLDAAKWSVVGAKGGNPNFPGLNKAGDIRLYYSDGVDGSNTITVTSLETGATIDSITITYTGDTYNNGIVLVGGNPVSISGGSYPINSTSFVISNGNTTNVQVRISKIVISYTTSD